MDPDKDQTLRNYELERFNNSIFENFMGSQIQISKVIDSDGNQI